ncbi:hypothetical protein ACVK1X_004594 [Pseudomonas sp. PvR086]
MTETLNPMTVVGGQSIIFFVDEADPVIPKAIIPAREEFVEGEEIFVKFGNVEVAYHKYRQGDFFPIHIPLDKGALSQVAVAAEAYYTIKHLDGSTSTSSSFRAKVEMFNCQSSVSHANAV